MDEENQLISRFEQEIEQQRISNFKSNDENLDLLGQSESLENHVRMLMEQNKIVNEEIDKFVAEDEMIAQKLQNRKQSQSPQRPSHRLHQVPSQGCHEMGVGENKYTYQNNN